MYRNLSVSKLARAFLTGALPLRRETDFFVFVAVALFRPFVAAELFRATAFLGAAFLGAAFLGAALLGAAFLAAAFLVAAFLAGRADLDVGAALRERADLALLVFADLALVAARAGFFLAVAFFAVTFFLAVALRLVVEVRDFALAPRTGAFFAGVFFFAVFLTAFALLPVALRPPAPELLVAFFVVFFFGLKTQIQPL